MLEHLQGLLRLGCALPDDMKAQIQEQIKTLEAKQSSIPRPLSHTHIHQLNRAQRQLQAIQKKVTGVDQEWRVFAQAVAIRVPEHAQWYQAHRSELMAQHASKTAELDELKKQVTEASQTLVETAQPPPPPPTAPDPAQDFAQLQATLTSLGQVPFVDLSAGDAEDMEDEPLPDATEESAEEGAEKPRTRRPIQPRPFASGQVRSPLKVAQSQLKIKVESSSK